MSAPRLRCLPFLGVSALLFSCLFQLLAGCDSKDTGPTTSSASGGRRVTLQLNWKPEPQFGGFYAAEQVGAYGERGLDVDVVPGGVGTPTVQMVGAGKVDFAVVSADEVVVARSQGNDVVALFAVYQTSPQGLMTRASRGLKEIGDVFRSPGTVAMQRGLPYASYLEQKFGFDQVKIVPSPGGDLSVFRSDENFAMQCFVTSEPIAARKLGIEPKTFLVADAGYNPYTTVLVTRGGYARENARVISEMVGAVARGWRAYLDDPKPANDLMMRLNPTMDAETFAAAAAAQRPLIEPAPSTGGALGGMTLERWTALSEQLQALKVVDRAADPASCFLSPLTPSSQPSRR